MTIYLALCPSQTTTVVRRRGNGELQPPETQNDPNNDDDTRRRDKLTEEAKLQKERTNRGGRDDVTFEGNVVDVSGSGESPPYVVAANRDGRVKVVLLHDARHLARSIKVGHYLEADGEKIHELLFEAHDAKISTPPRRR